jgi:2-methylcitrate dehydratase PrpD
MNPTETLAAFITKTSWEDIPDEAVQKSKWPILDGIAVTFGGLPHEVGKTIVSFVKEMGGKPTATVLGDGHRLRPVGSLCQWHLSACYRL